MSKPRVILRFIFIMLFMPVLLLAQEEKTGNWLMYFGMNKVSKHLSIHTEIQYRHHSIIPNNVEQLLLRSGLNFHFSKKSIFTAGYAYIPSYIYQSVQKSPETIEHRIWQQFILTNNIARIKFEHRYRIEQRWINHHYKNRFRYRLMLFVPVNKKIIEKGSLFLALYDEIFIQDKKHFFDRNRLYGALAYQFHKTSSIQAGMLHQRINDYGKWYLQFAIIYNPNLRANIPE